MLLFYQDRHCLSEWAVLWSLLPQDWGGRGEIQQALNLWKLILPPRKAKSWLHSPRIQPTTWSLSLMLPPSSWKWSSLKNSLVSSSLKLLSMRYNRAVWNTTGVGGYYCKRLKVKMFLQADLWLHQKLEKPLCVLPKRILQGSFGQNKHFLTTHVSCSPLIFKEKQAKA